MILTPHRCQITSLATFLGLSPKIPGLSLIESSIDSAKGKAQTVTNSFPKRRRNTTNWCWMSSVNSHNFKYLTAPLLQRKKRQSGWSSYVKLNVFPWFLSPCKWQESLKKMLISCTNMRSYTWKWCQIKPTFTILKWKSPTMAPVFCGGKFSAALAFRAPMLPVWGRGLPYVGRKRLGRWKIGLPKTPIHPGKLTIFQPSSLEKLGIHNLVTNSLFKSLQMG